MRWTALKGTSAHGAGLPANLNNFQGKPGAQPCIFKWERDRVFKAGESGTAVAELACEAFKSFCKSCMGCSEADGAPASAHLPLELEGAGLACSDGE